VPGADSLRLLISVGLFASAVPHRPKPQSAEKCSETLILSADLCIISLLLCAEKCNKTLVLSADLCFGIEFRGAQLPVNQLILANLPLTRHIFFR
jgi:hypothetical protein